MKAAEGASDGLRDALCLAAVEENGGNRDLVKYPRYLRRHLLLGYDLENAPPNLTCAFEVTLNGWRVAVVVGDDAPQIIEGFHRAEGVCAVDSELTPRRCCYLVRQLSPLQVHERIQSHRSPDERTIYVAGLGDKPSP